MTKYAGVTFNAQLFQSPEFAELAAAGRHRAALVHILAHAYATEQETDGWIPIRALRTLFGKPHDARALIELGLWSEVFDGWQLLDWVEHRALRPRKAIPKATRAFVFRRDGYACVKCGSVDNLSIDHVLAWSRGGSDRPDNLQTLCLSCNSKKRDT